MVFSLQPPRNRLSKGRCIASTRELLTQPRLTGYSTLFPHSGLTFFGRPTLPCRLPRHAAPLPLAFLRHSCSFGYFSYYSSSSFCFCLVFLSIDLPPPSPPSQSPALVPALVLTPSSLFHSSSFFISSSSVFVLPLAFCSLFSSHSFSIFSSGSYTSTCS